MHIEDLYLTYSQSIKMKRTGDDVSNFEVKLINTCYSPTLWLISFIQADGHVLKFVFKTTLSQSLCGKTCQDHLKHWSDAAPMGIDGHHKCWSDKHHQFYLNSVILWSVFEILVGVFIFYIGWCWNIITCWLKMLANMVSSEVTNEQWIWYLEILQPFESHCGCFKWIQWN